VALPVFRNMQLLAWRLLTVFLDAGLSRRDEQPVCERRILMLDVKTNRLQSTHTETDPLHPLSSVLTALFLAALVAFFLVMVWLGPPHGLRSLIRLVSSLGLAVVATGIIWLLHLFPRR
jgi:hypothetical protein